MKDPHNYKQVGYAMIIVSASLVSIAFLGLVIGEDVLYSDKIQRGQTALFEQCKEVDFAEEKCRVFKDRIENPLAGMDKENGK